MNYLKISVGFFLLALMLLFFKYELKKIKGVKKGDWILISCYVQIFSGIVALIIFGVVLIYNGVYNKSVGFEFLDKYDGVETSAPASRGIKK